MARAANIDELNAMEIKLQERVSGGEERLGNIETQLVEVGQSIQRLMVQATKTNEDMNMGRAATDLTEKNIRQESEKFTAQLAQGRTEMEARVKVMEDTAKSFEDRGKILETRIGEGAEAQRLAATATAANFERFDNHVSVKLGEMSASHERNMAAIVAHIRTMGDPMQRPGGDAWAAGAQAAAAPQPQTRSTPATFDIGDAPRDNKRSGLCNAKDLEVKAMAKEKLHRDAYLLFREQT